MNYEYVEFTFSIETYKIHTTVHQTLFYNDAIKYIYEEYIEVNRNVYIYISLYTYISLFIYIYTPLPPRSIIAA